MNATHSKWPSALNGWPLALAVLILTLSVAQSEGIPKELIWGKQLHGCQLGIQADSITAIAGDPIDVFILIENNGDEDVVYGENLGWPLCQFSATATLPDGKDATRSAYAKQGVTGASSTVIRKLHPGDKIKAKLRISRMLDMTVAVTYTVTVKYTFHGSTDSTDDFVVESKPITIKVHEADSDEAKK